MITKTIQALYTKAFSINVSFTLNPYFTAIFGSLFPLLYKEDILNNKCSNIVALALAEVCEKCDINNLKPEASSYMS